MHQKRVPRNPTLDRWILFNKTVLSVNKRCHVLAGCPSCYDISENGFGEIVLQSSPSSSGGVLPLSESVRKHPHSMKGEVVGVGRFIVEFEM
jgi:hypothetical protein